MEKRKRGFSRQWAAAKFILALITAVFVIFVSVSKYRSDEVNYRNSDAAWHTLLTIEAYSETPASQHLFLPIVSLGNQDNKNISWGATIPDDEGNYYYTSFSPAGYFLPWLFFKIFKLSVCEKSLYIFNTFLFGLSAILWMLFLMEFYEKEEKTAVLAIVGTIIYVLSPELLHGMGIVYWHQSLMQLTLLIQFAAYYKMKEGQSKLAGIIFYTMALINPYIEWTGYVANVGFALAEMISGYKNNFRVSCRRILTLAFLTVCSFGIFSWHYLLRVDAQVFFDALKSRFMARNITTSVEYTALFGSYLKSFLFWWIFLFVLVIWILIKRKSLAGRNLFWLFVFLFPAAENILMKQHAISYTYDKMKLVFFFSLLACELVVQLDRLYTDKKKAFSSLIIIFTLACGLLNYRSYKNDSSYIWEANYRADNERIADYINENYSDAVLGVEDASIRGYMNLLFGKGIYEYTKPDRLLRRAKSKGKRYAVMITIEDKCVWNMYDLSGGIVYDRETDTVTELTLKDGSVSENQIEEKQ